MFEFVADFSMLQSFIVIFIMVYAFIKTFGK